MFIILWITVSLYFLDLRKIQYSETVHNSYKLIMGGKAETPGSSFKIVVITRFNGHRNN